MKIAVVGSGISGMAAAHILCRNHQVTVFEKNSNVGGHTRTKNINYDGTDIAVDTGFIVFNPVNYPELIKLFSYLDVAYEKSDMSFGISAQNGAFEWGARNLNSLFGQRTNLVNPTFYRMLHQILKFFKKASNESQLDEKITLGDYLIRNNYKPVFIEKFILPMGAAIWSCPTAKMLDFPAATFIRFFQNHNLLTATKQHQWYTVSGGSQNYIHKILSPLNHNVHCNAEVISVERVGQYISIKTTDGHEQRFDHVVIAAHADKALSMLINPTSEEQTILSSFSYQKNIAYLHRDECLMPKRKACWSSWNFMSASDDQSEMTLTYWMNLLQNIDFTKPLFVTLNPIKKPDSQKTFDVHEFHHPVFTRAAITAQKNIHVIQNKNGISYCGAYQGYGFHEDGLVSAIKVAQNLGEHIPWH